MSKNLRYCMKTMHLYCDTKCPKLKKSLLKEMSEKECYFKALFEIVHNIAINKLKLTHKEKGKIKKSIKLMENILKNPKRKKKKQLLIKQSGGFFPFILPLLTSTVAGLLGNAIS